MKNPMAQLGNTNKTDKSNYLFYSKTDIFIGTRRELENYADLRKFSINVLFSNRTGRKPQKETSGWSVLNFTQFVLLNFLILLEK